MKKKKYKIKTEISGVNEPDVVAYQKSEIRIFNSHEEQEMYSREKMAGLSPLQLLTQLENMRRFFLRDYLLSNGDWKPIERTITITKQKTDERSI